MMVTFSPAWANLFFQRRQFSEATAAARLFASSEIRGYKSDFRLVLAR